MESVTGTRNGKNFTYVEKIGYDEWSQRVYLKLGNGVETKYEYDENRRWLDKIHTSSGSTVLQNISYSFDDVGNVGGYSNTAGSYSTSQEYEYDGLYQLIGAAGTTEQMRFGQMEYTASYSQVFTFDSEGLGRMSHKTSSTTQSDSRKIGDDLDYDLDYDYEEGYVHRVKRIGSRYYKYDLNGNVILEQDTEIASDDSGITYTVQDLGNDTYVSDYGWGMETQEGAVIQTTSGFRRTYSWNERNLITTTSDNRYLVNYRYDHAGERVGKFAVQNNGGSASETLYFNKMWSWRYDGLQSERLGRNSKHIYLGATRILTKVARADGYETSEDSIKQYYYHNDHLGSAQLITNADGEEYERIEYTPYGELWVEKASAASNIDIPYRFTGKERDEETGLYYFGARYLDPKTSRWLSADPALGDYIPGAPVNDEAKKRNGNLPGMGGVFNLVNLHLYHYAGNNPVKYTDPDGREAGIPSDISKTLNYYAKNQEFASVLRSAVGANYSHNRPPTNDKIDCSGMVVYALQKMGYDVPNNLTAKEMAGGDIAWVSLFDGVEDSRQGSVGVLNFYKFNDPEISHVNVGVGRTDNENENQIVDASVNGTNWPDSRNKQPNNRQSPKAIAGKVNKTWAPFSTNTKPDLQAIIDWEKLSILEE